jgi:hypothetical protein
MQMSVGFGGGTVWFAEAATSDRRNCDSKSRRSETAAAAQSRAFSKGRFANRPYVRLAHAEFPVRLINHLVYFRVTIPAA